MKNYTNISKIFLLLIFPLLFVACDDDEDDLVNEVVAPATYEFTRDGVSTVSFSGQTTRLNQVDAIYNYLNFKAEDGSKPVFKTEAQLKEMFADGAGFMTASLNGTGKKVRSKTGSGCNTTTGASVQVFMDNLLKEFQFPLFHLPDLNPRIHLLADFFFLSFLQPLCNWSPKEIKIKFL